jgi:hypothetical protein
MLCSCLINKPTDIEVSTNSNLISEHHLNNLHSFGIVLLHYIYSYFRAYSFFFSFLGWCETVHLVRRPLIGLLYQPRMVDDDDDDDDECGAVGGMRTGRGNRSTRRKPAPVPLCPPQVPHILTWARTLAATVGSRRLTS